MGHQSGVGDPSARESGCGSCAHFSARRISRLERAAPFVALVKENEGAPPRRRVRFSGLARSALIGRVSRPREFWGMSDGREGSRLLYHRVAKVDRCAHAVDRYLKLPEAFGVPIPARLRFPLPTGDALPRFDPYPPFVLLHPFARGARKSLSNSVIEEFCHAFDPTAWSSSARPWEDRDSGQSREPGKSNQPSPAHWLIRTARFTISVDSGPMHIAAAVTSAIGFHSHLDGSAPRGALQF